MATTMTENWPQLSDGLRAFIAKRVGNESDVEDILQEVFLRMHRRIESLNDPRRVISWLYQITRHVIIDHYRTPARRREMPAGLTADMETVGRTPTIAALFMEEPDTGELRSELAGCLRPMIEQLRQEYREALRLVELEGLTQQAAAKRVGISVSGMKSRVQRGRRQLKRMLDDCCLIRLDPRNGVTGYTVRGRKRSSC